MANRRMFSLDVIDTDLFLDMPATSQSLYFHLGMRADDDGFVSSPKKITKMVNCADDDLRILASRGFIIPFDNGVIVISHWKQNNYLQSDRHKDTIYQKELSSLTEENGVYKMDTDCIQDVSKMETQVSIGKVSKGKDKEYSSNFAEFWSVYPRKKEKSKAYKCYQARLSDGYSKQELLTAAKQYADEIRRNKIEERYIKLPATFLGSNMPFTDYLGKGERKNANTGHKLYK